MCGFIATKEKKEANNISRRGPDDVGELEFNGLYFKHFLLHITGEKLLQPFIDGDIVCLYNGEIYNLHFEKSDGENLIPLYKEHGVDFVKYLDGEFAIALYDFSKGIAIFSTDQFATKPIWYNGIEVASYNSGLNFGGEKIPANTTIVLNLNGDVIEKRTVIDWDLEQFKFSYDDWLDAFSLAVKKRATQDCFLGLSSGYDSGAIACELNKLGIDFKAFSFVGNENINVLKKRLRLIKNNELINLDDGLFNFVTRYIKENVDKFDYRVFGQKDQIDIFTDNASYALGYICQLAKNEGRRVYLSGQGADEILSDYSLFPGQSELKGVFPDDLKLWYNFYDGCQYSYLGKEEYIAGAFGIETRYPFLDKALVQEFLWLSKDLKNMFYKAPLRKYLSENNFPFDEGKKVGFNI